MSNLKTRKCLICSRETLVLAGSIFDRDNFVCADYYVVPCLPGLPSEKPTAVDSYIEPWVETVEDLVRKIDEVVLKVDFEQGEVSEYLLRKIVSLVAETTSARRRAENWRRTQRRKELR